MNRLAAAVVVVALVLGLAGYSVAEDRPIVAVFAVENQGSALDTTTIDRLNNYLCSLVAGKGYQVVPRAKLQEILRDKKKESYDQCYDQACQIQIGQELAAQKSLATQIILLGGKCKVALTLYDLKRSTSEKGLAVSGGCDEAQIVESLEKAVEQLVGAGAGQPPTLAIQPAPPVEKAGLTWVKSGPAGIEFTKSEITVAQYRTCVVTGTCIAYRSTDKDQMCNWGYFNHDNHPMNCVSWNQANDFCTWVGGRLPTEEEWYAEASNNGTWQYPWGDQEVTCDYAVWKNGCGRGSTWPVCTKEKGNSVSGLCDMGGNVWEWMSSSEGSDRIIRGGSWSFGDPSLLRAQHRAKVSPMYGSDTYGFRCGRPSK